MNKSQEEKTKEIYNELTKITPGSLQKKLIYIQKINEERIKMQETTYEVEYLNLKRQYDLEYEKCYNEISKIVKGELYPKITAEEAKKYELTNPEAPSSETGIEDFWLTALSHATNFVTVNANDEKILKHLTDVKIVNKEDRLTFSLEFHFTPNDYFTNEVLTKTYIYDVKDHQCHDVESTKIEWKAEDKIPNTIIKTKTVKSNFI